MAQPSGELDVLRAENQVLRQAIAERDHDILELAEVVENDVAHLGEAQAMAASSGPSMLAIIAGVAAVGLIGAWAFGAFDAPSHQSMSMGDARGTGEPRGVAKIADKIVNKVVDRGISKVLGLLF